VRVYVPCGVFGFDDIVRVVLPEPTTDVGLNEAPVFAGNPLRLKFTVAENDPRAVTVTVYVVFALPCTVRLLGDATIEKSATVSVTWVE
jgi:hypothetical protein